MKTWIATNIFCDYSCGMLVVKAETREDALQLIKEKFIKDFGEWFYDANIKDVNHLR